VDEQDSQAAIAHIDSIIRRGSDIVHELNDLIKIYLSRTEITTGILTPRHRGWLKHKRIERIYNALTDTRHKLVAALTAINTLQLCVSSCNYCHSIRLFSSGDICRAFS
jgi:hypothetical protein